MTTNRLSPIPIPLSRRWLEIRRRTLPVAAFACIALFAIFLWETQVAPPTLLAEVESIQADVSSVQGGTLISLDVDLMESVTAGSVIGHLQQADPAVLRASLAVIRAEINYLEKSMEPVLLGRRVELDFESLKLNWMRERVTLASLRAELIEAESVFNRSQQLYSQNVNAEQDYTTAKNLRDGLLVQIQQQEQLIGSLESEMHGANISNPRIGDAEAALAAAIQVQEEKLRLTEAQLGRIALRTPIDGIVMEVCRQVGETVAPGEPVIRLAATEGTRLIGYARQPLTFEPRPGQTVEIRTRAPNRKFAFSTIEAVGAVMEPVSPTILTALNRSDIPELGLRVHIRMPAEHNLRPGECVDVIVREDQT